MLITGLGIIGFVVVGKAIGAGEAAVGALASLASAFSSDWFRRTGRFGVVARPLGDVQDVVLHASRDFIRVRGVVSRREASDASESMGAIAIAAV